MSKGHAVNPPTGRKETPAQNTGIRRLKHSQPAAEIQPAVSLWDHPLIFPGPSSNQAEWKRRNGAVCETAALGGAHARV
jgi:hypothetical protein